MAENAQMLQGDFDLRKPAKRAPKALTVDVDQDNDDVEQAPLAIENGGSDSDAEAEEEVVDEIVVEDAVVAEALAGDAALDDDMVRSLVHGGRWGAFAFSWAIPLVAQPRGGYHAV